MKLPVPQDVLASVCKDLNINLTEIREFRFCSGGCINNGGKLVTDNGVWFLKWNKASTYPDMFQAELEGLKELRRPDSIRIPKPLTAADAEEHSYILMEFIEESPRASDYWKQLGIQLSELHRQSQPQFGLSINNYIGSLNQKNTLKGSWIDFFMEMRLQPQTDLALKKQRISGSLAGKIESFYPQLSELLILEKPSLLHGDLWSGNLITDNFGAPCIIDPAVYYGNREVDLGYTMLFGGFSQEFYQSYHENFPLEPGWRERAEIYNLFPLLVHVNLFGGGYANQVEGILDRYL